MTQTGRASAPASSANLGPGFDCIALALDLRCSVVATPADEWQVLSGGERAGEEAAAFVRAAAERSGGAVLRIEIESAIPLAGGLGSSAAVATATTAAAIRASGREPGRDEVFRLVADLEGHCDNAAATVYGGLVAVVDLRLIPLEMSSALVPVVAVPAMPLRTMAARRSLPDQVSHAVAARSVARAVALVEGLRTGLAGPLAAAADDELHEPHRAGLSPQTGELMAVARRAGALHVAWSGAGPSVLALAAPADRDAVMMELKRALGDDGTVLAPDVDRTGLV